MIFIIVAIILDNVLGLTIEELPYGVFYVLYSLAILIPGLAVAVRRLHDVGKSGWMLLISFIPLVGGIWLIVLMLTDSNPGENKYGANPKNVFIKDKVSVKSSDGTIILLVVIWMVISRVFWTLIPKFIVNYSSEEWFKPVNGLMSLIYGFIPIGLAFAVKDKTKRIILFILGGIYLAINLYGVVTQFIR